LSGGKWIFQTGAVSSAPQKHGEACIQHMLDDHRWGLWKDGLASRAEWRAVRRKCFLGIVRYYREIIKRWSILLVMGMIGQRREAKGEG